VGIYYNDSLTISTGGGGGGGGGGRAPPRYLRLAGLVNMGINAWVERFLGEGGGGCEGGFVGGLCLLLRCTSCTGQLVRKHVAH
jgi:hypothetical protein